MSLSTSQVMCTKKGIGMCSPQFIKQETKKSSESCVYLELSYEIEEASV